jgi:hypothetical protein
MTSRRTKFKNYVDEEAKRKNTAKARVRAKVEWPFRILKRIFGFTKVRYRGMVKNYHCHLAAFALVNLYQHRKKLYGRITPQLAPLGVQCLWRPENGLPETKPTRSTLSFSAKNLCRIKKINCARVADAKSCTCAEIP